MTYFIVSIALSAAAIIMGWDAEDVLWPAMPAILVISFLLGHPISQWITGRRDIFDPICLMAIFGILFFLFGPLYQLSSAYFPYLIWGPELQSWSVAWFYCQAAFLGMALVFSGQFKLTVGLRTAKSDEGKPFTILKSKWVLPVLVITGFVKALTFLYFGGLSGALNAYDTRLTHGILENNPFSGIGPLVLVGDMFPIALGVYLIARWRDRRWFSRGTAFYIFAATLMGVALLTVGLRGSRSSVVFAMAIVVLSYHFLVKPLAKRHLLIGAVALFVFMQGYLAYKFGGLDAVLSSTARQETFSARQLDDDGARFVLIRDFTRLDVQVHAIKSVAADEYPLAWGRSILSGVTAIIPSAVIPFRPETFIKEKTEIMYPNRTYVPQGATTLVFGGFGELFVNFGWLSLAFGVPFGWLLRFLRSSVVRARQNVASALVAPVASLLPIALLVYDSNSLAYFAVQFCLVSWYLGWRVGRASRSMQRAVEIKSGRLRA